jgi:hypothetical protein
MLENKIIWNEFENDNLNQFLLISNKIKIRSKKTWKTK